MNCPWVHSLSRIVRVVTSRYAEYYVTGGTISRRSKLALFGLTMLPLSQAWPLGGLHRASPVPFRGSYFTPGLHPPDATPQRLIAYLYRQWSFPLIPSLRFVAHPRPLLLHRGRLRRPLPPLSPRRRPRRRPPLRARLGRGLIVMGYVGEERVEGGGKALFHNQSEYLCCLTPRFPLLQNVRNARSRIFVRMRAGK